MTTEPKESKQDEGLPGSAVKALKMVSFTLEDLSSLAKPGDRLSVQLTDKGGNLLVESDGVFVPQPEWDAITAKAERLDDLESGHGQCDCHYAPCQHDLAARLQEVEWERDTARSTAGQYLAQIDKLKRELKQSEGRYHELVEALRPELKAEQAKIETESKQ